MFTDKHIQTINNVFEFFLVHILHLSILHGTASDGLVQDCSISSAKCTGDTAVQH